MDIAEPVNRLVEQFKKLPGIGTKSAQRLAFFILKMDQADATELAESIIEVKRLIRRCSTCNSLTEPDPCEVCSDPERDAGLLCVVEDPGNVAAIEKTLDQEGECSEVLHNISACRGAMDALMAEVIEGHIRFHILPANGGATDEQKRAADDLVTALRAYLK